MTMKQTPVHEIHNDPLLKLIPLDARFLVEVGCSSGALAREYKKLNGAARYLGIEIEPSYAEMAKRHCDEVLVGDIENMSADFWASHSSSDCWIFADVLEHLRDPWHVLSMIRKVIPDGGSIVCCIPNIQHWSVQARISTGDFQYEELGILDKTHLRWFTRKTILEMFKNAGFEVAQIRPLSVQGPEPERLLIHIGRLAHRAGADLDEAITDARAFQYVVRAVPSKSAG